MQVKGCSFIIIIWRLKDISSFKSYPITKQEIAVPRKAYAKIDPRFRKKCLWQKKKKKLCSVRISTKYWQRIFFLLHFPMLILKASFSRRSQSEQAFRYWYKFQHFKKTRRKGRRTWKTWPVSEVPSTKKWIGNLRPVKARQS